MGLLCLILCSWKPKRLWKHIQSGACGSTTLWYPVHCNGDCFSTSWSCSTQRLNIEHWWLILMVDDFCAWFCQLQNPWKSPKISWSWVPLYCHPTVAGESPEYMVAGLCCYIWVWRPSEMSQKVSWSKVESCPMVTGVSTSWWCCAALYAEHQCRARGQ